MRKYLICLDEVHAGVVDQFIAAWLHDIDGSQCSSWSGVFTDGTRYAVLWDTPASNLFGLPEDCPELKLASSGDWTLVVAENEEGGAE